MKFVDARNEELARAVEARLSPKRFSHTLAVKDAAIKLASYCLKGYSSEIESAALLHDIAKELPTEELISLIKNSKREIDEEDEELIAAIKDAPGGKICILNKDDGEQKLDTGRLNCDFDAVIRMSARDNGDMALSLLTDTVNRLFTDEKISTSTDAVVASARQHASLSRAREFIDAAITAYSIGMPADAASSDIELALGAIGELDGRSVSENVVGDIFSRFCVGK